jgi:hypothetical protein
LTVSGKVYNKSSLWRTFVLNLAIGGTFEFLPHPEIYKNKRILIDYAILLDFYTTAAFIAYVSMGTLL